MTPRILADFQRLIVRDRDSDCWVWCGSRTAAGYGRFWTGRHGNRGAHVYAHRFAFAQRHGSVETNRHEVIRHTCDRPSCVNPDHLVGGTHADNARDCVERGRRITPSLRGSKHPQAKLTEREVRSIRRRVANGESTHKLAVEYGVAQQTLHKAVAGATWKHVV